MANFQCICLLFLVITVTDFLDYSCAQDVPGCPTHLPNTDLLTDYKEKCYQFVHTEKFWTKARDFCHDHRGDLIKLDNPDLNNFIKSKIKEISWKNNGIWIGLNDRQDEGSWRWESRTGPEEVAHWTNWARGHPVSGWLHSGRDCVRMKRDESWRWGETYCDTLRWKYRFICEYEKIPEEGEGEGSEKEDQGPNAVEQKSVSEKSSNHTATFVGLGIGLGLLLLLVLILVLVLVLNRRRNRRKQEAANQTSQTQTPAEHTFENRAFRSDVTENEYTYARGNTGQGQNGQQTTGAAQASPPPSYATYDNTLNEFPGILAAKQKF